MRRDRALLLTPAMPADRGNGLAMRAGLLLAGLARGFAVDVVGVPVFGGFGAPGGLVRERARHVHSLPLDPAANPARELVLRLRTPAGRRRAQALHPLPDLCSRATVAAGEEVAALAQDAELVLVFRTYLAPVLDDLLDGPARPRIVIDVDDVESATQLRLGNAEQAQRFERLEAYYLPLADGVTTCSNADSRELATRLALQRVSVVPNAVRLPTQSKPPTGEFDVLLVGNLSYEPNVEAARWLCEAVLPELGEVRVAIVGSRPPAEVLALGADPRVTVAADVPDVAPWYAAASVAVVPLQHGGGSRIKLIEAFAHRRPVVATPAGADGLPWPADRSPVVVAQTPVQFADACRELLADPGRAQQLAQAGEQLVRARANVDIVAAQLDELMRSIQCSTMGAPR